MTASILIFLFSVFVSACSQIALKKSADVKYDSILKEYLNPRVIIAYGLFFLSSLITVFAYRGVPLSLGPALEATGYVFVAALGYLFLKERIGKRKLLGLFLIILGVGISGLG